MDSKRRGFSRLLCGAGGALTVVAALTALGAGGAQAAERSPVRIGVIAAATNPVAAGIIYGAALATDEINAAGGIDGRKVELFKYDDHFSASDGVRAFQRAVKQDHVVAVVGGFISEIDLALMPWASRLRVPFIASGASDKIATLVHANYERYKYVFQQSPNSHYLAQAICDISHDTLVKRFHFKTAAIMSEDAAWTKPLDHTYQDCLPKAGLKVVTEVRFSPGTSDFSPIFSRIEADHAAVIIAGMAHVGLKPTVQWHDQRVPAVLAGFNAQAGSSSFWRRSNGATEGVITWSAGAPGGALTPKSVPFSKAYQKRYGTTPSAAYMTYDSMYALKQAIERAHSTRPDALVAALERTDVAGAMGRVQFYGRSARFTHDVKYGRDFVSGVGIQWQHGKQVVIWPPHAANGAPTLPRFVAAAHGK